MNVSVLYREPKLLKVMHAATQYRSSLYVSFSALP